jgi:TctA family transporter
VVVRGLRDLVVETERVVTGATEEHSKLFRRLVTAFVATLVIDVIGTALMYAFEHGKGGSAITSVFTGFFWVTTQLLTVSSQMPNPVTTGGRVVDIFLEIWAISVVASVTGSFASFLQNKP